jgi:hypothetical protein
VQQGTPTRCNNESSKVASNKTTMTSNKGIKAKQQQKQQCLKKQKTLTRIKMHNEHET